MTEEQIPDDEPTPAPVAPGQEALDLEPGETIETEKVTETVETTVIEDEIHEHEED